MTWEPMFHGMVNDINLYSRLKPCLCISSLCMNRESFFMLHMLTSGASFFKFTFNEYQKRFHVYICVYLERLHVYICVYLERLHVYICVYLERLYVYICVYLERLSSYLHPCILGAAYFLVLSVYTKASFFIFKIRGGVFHVYIFVYPKRLCYFLHLCISGVSFFILTSLYYRSWYGLLEKPVSAPQNTI